jgi:hypothetical protein
MFRFSRLFKNHVDLEGFEHAHSQNALDSFLSVMPMVQIALKMWTCPARGWIARKMCHLYVREFTSPHYSREFVTKPPRRHARRARGAVREGGILETVC